MIIAGDGIVTAIKYVRKESEGKLINYLTLKYSLSILERILIFGSVQTQQLIKNSISIEIIQKIKYNDEIIKKFLTSCQFPETIKLLLRIKRIVERRSENELVKLIKSGLIKIFNEIIEKTFQINDGEYFLIIIGEIIKILVENHSEVSRIIVEQTDFVDNYLHSFSICQLDQINEEFLIPLQNLSKYIPNEQKKKLFEKNTIQIIINKYEQKYQYLPWDIFNIIFRIIEAGAYELKEGQQHPYFLQLQQDGTIIKLIQLLKKNNRSYISSIFVYLFKAQSLPIEIKQQIVEHLKNPSNIDLFAILSECIDNHDAILANDFEKKIFKYEYDNYYYIQIVYQILKYGSNNNKKKITLFVNKKIELLNHEEDVDVLKNHYFLREEYIQEIKPKIKEMCSIIKCVEEIIEQDGEYEEINACLFKSNNIDENKDKNQELTKNIKIEEYYRYLCMNFYQQQQLLKFQTNKFFYNEPKNVLEKSLEDDDEEEYDDDIHKDNNEKETNE